MVAETTPAVAWRGPFNEPTVSPPSVAVPRLALALNKFVELAVVAKKFVVVAFVPVAFTKVKFWRVEEPVESRLPKVPKAVVVMVFKVEIVPKPEAIEPDERAPTVTRLARAVRLGKVVVAERRLSNRVVV